MNSEQQSRGPYLIELDQEREKIAVQRAFSVDLILDPLLSDLRLSSRRYWAILELPVSAIMSKKDPTGKFDGEIDVLLGTRTLNEKGLLKWRPDEGPLAAIEAKAGYLSFKDDSLRFVSSKDGPGKRRDIKKELNRLVQVGVDRISLLDIIATPPSSSNLSGQAWLQAAEEGRKAIEAAYPVLSKRPLHYSFVGHWALGWGSVEGGPEHWRGAPVLDPLHYCDQNTQVTDRQVAFRRRSVQCRISELLSNLPHPDEMPCIARYCQTCLCLHQLYFGGAQESCPKEGKSSGMWMPMCRC